jgi:membrane associated rhomboid family serine protease
MSRPARLIERFSFGGRLPGAAGLLIALTLAASLVGAFGARHGAPAFAWLALEPWRVAHGEVWRLLTWVFVEPSPLSLLFGCYVLYWAGSGLAERWSNARLLAYYAGVTVAAALGTSAVGLIDPAVRGATYLGCWPLTAALVVAWGMYFPDRTVLLFFVLRVRGIVLAYLTLAVTAIYAVYEGWETYLPALFAMGTMLAWIFRRWIATRFGDLARARAREARRRADERRRAASAATSKTVTTLDELDHEEPPPIPPEVEAVLDRVLDEARARREKNQG